MSFPFSSFDSGQTFISVHPQTISINGSVAVSVINLTLDKADMGSKVACRAVNHHLDSTIMEDIWIVDLSCKWPVVISPAYAPWRSAIRSCLVSDGLLLSSSEKSYASR